MKNPFAILKSISNQLKQEQQLYLEENLTLKKRLEEIQKQMRERQHELEEKNSEQAAELKHVKSENIDLSSQIEGLKQALTQTRSQKEEFEIKSREYLEQKIMIDQNLEKQVEINNDLKRQSSDLQKNIKEIEKKHNIEITALSGEKDRFEFQNKRVKTLLSLQEEKCKQSESQYHSLYEKYKELEEQMFHLQEENQSLKAGSGSGSTENLSNNTMGLFKSLQPTPKTTPASTQCSP
jgi:chromosome segregation ATPase